MLKISNFYGLDRHATLAASHEELKGHIADCEAEIDIIRSELQEYMKNSANTILTLNNDISITRLKVEGKRQETIDLQLNIDSMLQMAAARTLAQSQVHMIRNLILPPLVLGVQILNNK